MKKETCILFVAVLVLLCALTVVFYRKKQNRDHAKETLVQERILSDDRIYQG